MAHQSSNDSYRQKAAYYTKEDLAMFYLKKNHSAPMTLLQLIKHLHLVVVSSGKITTYMALSPQRDSSALLDHHGTHHAVPTPPTLGCHF